MEAMFLSTRDSQSLLWRLCLHPLGMAWSKKLCLRLLEVACSLIDFMLASGLGTLQSRQRLCLRLLRIARDL